MSTLINIKFRNKRQKNMMTFSALGELNLIRQNIISEEINYVFTI